MGWGLRSWRRRAAAEAGRAAAGRGFLADRRGSTLIEFGLLALPFSLLVFSTLESCVSFAGQESMANAAHDVSRLIFTGKIRAADVDAAKLKTMLCDRMGMVAPADCANDIIVDLRAYPTFAAAAAQRFTVANGELDTSGFKVEVGGAGTKSMLRVFYKWPVLSNVAVKMMPTTLKDGRMLHFASEIWQNEPFPD